MRKTLFCGVDLHSNNAMYVITDHRDKPLFRQRLPNELPIILKCLEPFRERLKVVAVESTYNWYWLVDGLQDHDCLTFVTTEQVELIELLSKTIKRFEDKVLEHAQLKPAYACLVTMPGVGVILALTIMLETGDLGRFETVGDYTSYCRCVRATHTSNGKRKARNNGRNGNAYLAWAFVEAVHHALRVCPQAKRFYDKKRAKRNGALATKALAAKWSKAAYSIMRRQEPFDLTRVFG